MDINALREIVTVLSFAGFAAVVWYAASPKNKQRFDAAAKLPLDEMDPLPNPLPKGEGANVGRGFADLERQ